MMTSESIQILAVSDQVVDRLYSPHIKKMFPDIDFILSCGDLPFYYLEYMLDVLNVRMYFVHGNHDPEIEINDRGNRRQPWGAENIHCRIIEQKGVIILGFEGAIRYSNAKHQYTQFEVWMQVLRMVPPLLWKRIIRGRFLDFLITHSPALGLGDADDPAHIGFKAYRWLLKVFKPRYHLHGHVHVYDRNDRKPRIFHETTILNVSSFIRLDFQLGVTRE